MSGYLEGVAREPKTAGPLLLKQAAILYPSGPDREKFIECLVNGVGREPAIIVVHPAPAIQTFPRLWPTEWQPEFVIRLAEHFRPGQHPLYQKGAFYSLDFSSVFSASAMLEIPEPPVRVLDLCASPGGKAVFAWTAFKPELLLCNETIRKRAGTLISNLERCKIEGSAVWSADPSVYASKYPEAFDLVLVDAPCSGQSLLAKGDPAPGAFSPHIIDMCVGRQRRILGNASRCVRPGGHMLYMTCTFTPKENEKVVAWLLSEYPEFEAVEIPKYAQFKSDFAEFPCYRLFPQDGFGAGAFTCLLRHTGEPPEHRSALEVASMWKYGDVREKPAAAPKEPKAQERYFKGVPYDPRKKKPRRGRR